MSEDMFAQKRAEFAEGFSSGDDRLHGMLGWDEGVKSCAAIKDAEIAELNNRLRIEENAHAELQSRCFDQGGTFSNVFDELKQCKAEIAARDLMINDLREELAKVKEIPFIGYEFPELRRSVGEALAKSEHHNSRALEKMLLEAELSGLRSSVIELAIYREREILAKLAELNKE